MYRCGYRYFQVLEDSSDSIAGVATRDLYLLSNRCAMNLVPYPWINGIPLHLAIDTLVPR